MLRIAEQSYAPGSRRTPHAHDMPSVSVVVAGAFRERMGRVEEIARPLSISFMPPQVTHADEFSPDGARLLTVHFDAESAERLASEDGALGEWRWVHGGPVVRLFLMLLNAVRNRHAPEVAELLVADILAAGPGTWARRATCGPEPRWLAQVRAAIDDTPAWPTVTELATIGGVHRVHLAKQFRRFYGCAVSEYTRRRRVQRAAQHMLSTRVSLSKVAHDAGFSDQPHFCRAFRRETGVTPTAFFELARSREPGDTGR